MRRVALALSTTVLGLSLGCQRTSNNVGRLAGHDGSVPVEAGMGGSLKTDGAAGSAGTGGSADSGGSAGNTGVSGQPEVGPATVDSGNDGPGLDAAAPDSNPAPRDGAAEDVFRAAAPEAGGMADVTDSAVGRDSAATPDTGIDTRRPDLGPPVVVGVSSGTDFTCALKGDGTIRCWGANAYSQLGNGSSDDSRTPITVPQIADAVAISADMTHACAVLSGGTIQCWGEADRGQLGNGTVTLRTTPDAVKNITKATTVSTNRYNSCALLGDGSVQCWGVNDRGQLGAATTGTCTIPNISAAASAPLFIDVACSTIPLAVPGLANVRTVGTGLWHSCALIADGTVQCWGGNTFGQVGDGTWTDRASPVAVPDINSAVALAVGSAHNCVLLADGAVLCWGFNGDRQVGYDAGEIADSRNLPFAVTGLTKPVDIFAGSSNSCALLSDGGLSCWGSNLSGQLGIGRTTLGNGIATPTPVASLKNVVDVSVGGDHVCALLSDKSVQCWGGNTRGQLGTGDTTDRLVPTNVIGL